jgi:hypothetical protein
MCRALEGRLHTLYLDHKAGRPNPRLLKVKALGEDVFDLESADLGTSFATQDARIPELPFGNGLDPRALLRY